MDRRPPRSTLFPYPTLSRSGLAVSAVTHYIADRRTPLLRLAEAMQPVTGKADFYRLGAPREGRDDNPSLGTGAYALDQSWHYRSEERRVGKEGRFRWSPYH